MINGRLAFKPKKPRCRGFFGRRGEEEEKLFVFIECSLLDPCVFKCEPGYIWCVYTNTFWGLMRRRETAVSHNTHQPWTHKLSRIQLWMSPIGRLRREVWKLPDLLLMHCLRQINARRKRTLVDKICRICHQQKSLTAFYKNRRPKSGLTTCCKTCTKQGGSCMS